jgi:hypothetical protein
MPANYVLLERIELNASAASITFANIPQTGYTDLKIVVSARGTANNAGNGQYYDIKINNSSANLTQRYIQGNGSSASSGSSSTTTGNYMPPSDYTANTFSNNEIYFPNYSGSTNKSFYTDSVNENNATSAFAIMNAYLWAQTAAINQITLTPGGGSFDTNSTFSLYGLAAVGTTPVIAPKASGGNIIDFDGTYWIHTFLTNGTFTPQTSLSCDYLVVAGGGGGGSWGPGGGGGSGGFRTSTGLSTTAQAYTITVGAGGAANASGTNSIFSTITSTGGGKGAGATGNDAANGGSGGGGSGEGGSATPGSGNAGSYSPVEGYAGGTGRQVSGTRAGGGGGGASAVGTSPSTANGGAGGAGIASSYSGASVNYAGGGGGATQSGSAGTATFGGGAGGVGAGGTAGTAGTVNTGGGGGGGGTTAGAGGSGIVIIRYLA